MKIIIRTVMLLSVSVISTTAFSQSCIAYKYDDAGNRISRNVVTSPRKAKASPESPNIRNVQSEMALSGHISVTYSARDDVAKIDLPQACPDKTFTVSVYGADGALLHSAKMENGTSAIPFSSFHKGIYLLSVECGNERRSVKITKN